MSVETNRGSALSLGRLGLALGSRHAYAATSSVVGLLLGTALVITGGVLLIVGLASLATLDSKKPKAEQT